MSTLDVRLQFGANLASRALGVRLRKELERLAPVVVDMQGVEVLSDSFADEAFAILVCRHGSAWFRANVKLQEVRSEHRETILSAVFERFTMNIPAK